MILPCHEYWVITCRYFVALSADPLLIWNYGAMAVFAFVAGIGFWLTFRHLDSQEEALNAITDAENVEKATQRSQEASNKDEKA